MRVICFSPLSDYVDLQMMFYCVICVSSSTCCLYYCQFVSFLTILLLLLLLLKKSHVMYLKSLMLWQLIRPFIRFQCVCSNLCVFTQALGERNPNPNPNVTWAGSPAKSNQFLPVTHTHTALPYLTLPYHTGKTFYRLALRPLTGPMRISELTVRLQNPQSSPGSIPTLGTIPSQVRAYSLGPTY